MRKTLTGVALTAAVAGTLAGMGPAHAATPAWKVAQTNNLPGEDTITALTVAPTGSSWAGGSQTVKDKEVPLIQHLTSKGWTTVKAPGSAGRVTALSASSSKNVWSFAVDGSIDQPARWNGTSWQWTSALHGFPATDAAAVSSANVWVVSGEPDSPPKYAEHWTGKSWKKVTLPAAATSISAVSSKNVWAAGTRNHQAAVMHWNGSSWKLLKTPAFKLPDPYGNVELRDIVALSSNSVWAVGGITWSCGEDGDSTCAKPLILHWNGHVWTSKLLPQTYTPLTQIAYDGVKGFWLLKGAWDPALVHYTGGTLTTVAAPRPAGHDINMTALATHGKTIWAGGAAFPEGDPDDPTGNGLYLRIN
jgi:hypothetical protein